MPTSDPVDDAAAALIAQPPDFEGFRNALSILEAQADWGAADRALRRAIAVASSASAPKGLDFELWCRLGRIALDGLKDDQRATIALDFAATLQPLPIELALELARAHGRLGNETAELEALRRVALRAERAEIWRRMAEIHRGRGEAHAVWAPLSFLVRGGSATREELAELAALQHRPVVGALDIDAWAMLVDPTDVELVELLGVVAPLLREARRLGPVHRPSEPWALAALGLAEVGGPPGAAPADATARFRSGSSATHAHPALSAARELAGSGRQLVVLYACIKLCSVGEALPAKVRAEAQLLALELRPLLSEATRARLEAAVAAVRQRGAISTRWHDLVRRVSTRAGLLLAGDLSAAEDVVRKEEPSELAHLVEFAASPAHAELRRVLFGAPERSASDVRAAERQGPESPPARHAETPLSALGELGAIAARLKQNAVPDAAFVEAEAHKFLGQVEWMLGERANVPELALRRVGEDRVTLSREGVVGRVEVRWDRAEGKMLLTGPRGRSAFTWNHTTAAFVDADGRRITAALDDGLKALFAATAPLGAKQSDPSAPAPAPARILIPGFPRLGPRVPSEPWELPFRLLYADDFTRAEDSRPLEDRTPIAVDSTHRRASTPAWPAGAGRLSQSLEAWTATLPALSTVRIDVLNVSRQDLQMDYEDAATLPQSGISKIIYSGEYGGVGGKPYAALILGYDVEDTPTGRTLLRKLAETCARAHVVLVLPPTSKEAAIRATSGNASAPYVGFADPTSVGPSLVRGFLDQGFGGGVDGVDSLWWVATRVTHCIKVRDRCEGTRDALATRLDRPREWLREFVSPHDDGVRPFQRASLDEIDESDPYAYPFQLTLATHARPGTAAGHVTIRGALEKE